MKTKESVMRIVIFSILLCVILGLVFSIYANKLIPKMDEMEEKGDEPNLLWLFEYASILLPTVVIVVFFGVCYMNKDKHIPVVSHREQFIIALVAIVFLYAILLPYAKGTVLIDPETEEQMGTLLQSTYFWFGVQVIPTTIIAAYHAIRSGTEKKELEGGKNEE
jgi:amino acid transporter